MIQIRKDSWHYRLYCWWKMRVDVSEPKNLCDYLWGILETFGQFALIGAIALWMLAIVVMGIFSLALLAIVLWTGLGPLMAIAVLAVVAGFCVAICLRESIFGSRIAQSVFVKTSGFFNLIGAYLKAKKEKYCPLVEVVDSKEDKRA
ncbi:MAG: hypothetical protein Q8L24_02580 [bacterium]|nr:hypothetical protein [bacterium]